VKNQHVKQDPLDNLADALTEDILNTPDDELLREVEEDYGDPRALANKFDQILERAEKQVFETARSAASPQVRSRRLSREDQRRLGDILQRVYDEVLRQGVPDRFKNLLDQFDKDVGVAETMRGQSGREDDHLVKAFDNKGSRS